MRHGRSLQCRRPLRVGRAGADAGGSLDLLGPSTAAALERLRSGVSSWESGRFGSTNGAAMRITPVGIACGLAPLAGFIDRVAQASMVTHNTGLGIGGAAAVVGAVSAGVAGATPPTPSTRRSTPPRPANGADTGERSGRSPHASGG